MGEPNTTQTPNSIFDDLMPQMKDSDLRVVLQITRYTFGWIADPLTGMRKKEDRIAHNLLVKRCGRRSEAICSAIDRCIKKGWIEARSEYGEILDTPERRRGKNIYYRLGLKLLHVSRRHKLNDALADDMFPEDTSKGPFRKAKMSFSESEFRKAKITKETLNKKRAGEIFNNQEGLTNAYKTNLKMRLTDGNGKKVVISRGIFRCKDGSEWRTWEGDWKSLLIKL